VADLNEAIRSFPLAGWLSSHTEVRDGGGRNYYADCPSCDGKQKLRVRKEDGRFKCFKCDAGEGNTNERWKGWGNLFSLVAFLEGLRWGEAIRFVVQRSGVPDLPLERADAPRHKIPKDAIPCLEVPDSHPSMKRLAERGLYHLRDKFYLCALGEYANRWILPCQFMGEVHGIEAKAWHRATQPKALYPTWFNPQESIYTTYAWDDSLPFAIVTESIFDAETFGLNAVGLYGSNLLPGQFDLLLKLRKRGVEALFWALDPDAWSKQAAAIVQKTSALFKNYIVEIPPLLPNGDKGDPNAIGHVSCWELVESAKQITSEWDLLATQARDL
jgi:hypothetical protein